MKGWWWISFSLQLQLAGAVRPSQSLSILCVEQSPKDVGATVFRAKITAMSLRGVCVWKVSTPDEQVTLDGLEEEMWIYLMCGLADLENVFHFVFYCTIG